MDLFFLFYFNFILQRAEFLKAMYFEKKDSFGFDKSSFMDCLYSDIKNKAFKDMSDFDFHNLVIEMVDSKMIDVDLKRNGEIIDGAIFILKKGIEYFGKITNQNRNN